jgi:hypothetical protein
VLCITTIVTALLHTDEGMLTINPSWHRDTFDAIMTATVQLSFKKRRYFIKADILVTTATPYVDTSQDFILKPEYLWALTTFPKPIHSQNDLS